jgi:ANTAR domain
MAAEAHGMREPGKADGQARRRADGAAPEHALPPDEIPVARRTPTGWRVGDEEVPDLTSAMVLADLLAAELPTESMPAIPTPPPAKERVGRRRSGHVHTTRQPADGEALDPRRLQKTVKQLEHALAARVRVEQAIGVLAERHRIRPRQAFELLRSAARARGRRVLEIATEVVESATNPLLHLPEAFAKPPVARRRGRIGRHTLET